MLQNEVGIATIMHKWFDNTTILLNLKEPPKVLTDFF
jgi:hypothetical protein